MVVPAGSRFLTSFGMTNFPFGVRKASRLEVSAELVGAGMAVVLRGKCLRGFELCGPLFAVEKLVELLAERKIAGSKDLSEHLRPRISSF
jgi:hypothetical protein